MTLSTSELRQLSQKHANLMAVLARTDEVPSTLSTTSTRIAEADDELAKKEDELKELAKKRTSDYKALDSFKSSSTKRLLYMVSRGGKQALEKRMERQEQEYQNTVQEEHGTMRDVDALKLEVSDLKTKKEDLTRRMEDRRKVLGELDDIYEEVFGRNDSGYPEEAAARAAHLHAKILEAERRSEAEPIEGVVALLSQAGVSIIDVLENYRKMRRSVNEEMLGGSSTFHSPRAAYHYLRQLQVSVKEAEAAIKRARDLDPDVREIPGCDVITQRDLDLYEIEISSFQTVKAEPKLDMAYISYVTIQKNIKEEFDLWAEKLKEAIRVAKDAQEHARHCKAELTAIRKDILVNISEGGSGGERLPDYVHPPGYSGSSSETTHDIAGEKSASLED